MSVANQAFVLLPQKGINEVNPVAPTKQKPGND